MCKFYIYEGGGGGTDSCGLTPIEDVSEEEEILAKRRSRHLGPDPG